MGRSVMVGRGPTGAEVLVLSILVILTTESCRAQKGWCHTAAVTPGGAEHTRTHAAMLLRGEHICLFTRMNTVFVRQTITYFYSVVFTWSSTWFAALAAARLGAFSAKRGCSKTRQTGSENTGIIKDKRSFEHHLFAELTCSL